MYFWLTREKIVRGYTTHIFCVIIIGLQLKFGVNGGVQCVPMSLCAIEQAN